MAYPYQQPNPPGGNYRPQVPQLGYVRPVSSYEEVRAYPIDFDGSVAYFADIANKRIYTKQFGPDGSAIVKLYEQKEIQEPSQMVNAFVTKEEFEKVINALIEKYENIINPKEIGNSEQIAKKPLFEI